MIPRSTSRFCLPILALALVISRPGGLDAAGNDRQPGSTPDAPAAAAAWPEVKPQTKPWTRWWWLGSAVTTDDLTRQLEGFAAAGLGGVEICPIYGVQGQESKDIPFLSEKWIAMLARTTREAKRLGLGVDLTTGTGWPFGGPMVTSETASAAMVPWQTKVEPGGKLTPPDGRLLVARATSADGSTKDLTGLLAKGPAAWDGDQPATVHGLLLRPGIQQVKRAAPGGEGLVLDPYSPEAMHSYLGHFDRALAAFDAPMPRAHFHDSFEYYGADISFTLPEVFRKNRGYALEDHLPALAGEGAPDDVVRVRADYRTTMGEMHTAYLAAWHDWAVDKGSLTRNQAHGSPGNLLDHYAVSDIPETEIFRHVEDNQLPMMRLAVSAAHATGRNLVSAESFTWLDEHFQVKPADLKEAADFLFLAGVNHLFFHGIPYSPAGAAWPGWLFYASTHFGPDGGLWRDLPAFTAYLRRCQSVLQDGAPSSDVLLYFPFQDILHDGAKGLPLFTLHNQNQWLWPTAWHRAAMAMREAGYTYDGVSDGLLAKAVVKDGKVHLGANAFQVLVVPSARHMPVETMARLVGLAGQGANIIIAGDWPDDVPGRGQLAERRAALQTELARAKALKSILRTPGDFLPALRDLKVRKEDLPRAGLSFVRRRHASGFHYFIVNRSGHDVDSSVTLGVPAATVRRFDLWSDAPGRVMESSATRGRPTIRLRLGAGESMVLRTFDQASPGGDAWQDFVARPAAAFLPGPWKLDFIDGGPVLPAAAETRMLGSWTTLPDPAAADFSGTGRYRTIFSGDLAAAGKRIMIDLGRVEGTARVRLNGQDIGTTWCAPHRLELTGQIQPGDNTLEVEVTNLAANRIAALDRSGAKWKIFREINFVSIHYQDFDASRWAPLDSGLLGPVRLLTGE